MKTQVMTQEDIRTRGINVLAKELGVVGMVRFVQQFSNGKGDYTKERHRWLDRLSIDDIMSDIRSKRRHHKQQA